MRDYAVRYHRKTTCPECKMECPWLYINAHGTITGVECPACGHQWQIDTGFGQTHTRPSHMRED